jgi:hypothetical protein
MGIIPSPAGAGALLLHGEDDRDCFVVFMGRNPSTQARTAALATFSWCTQSIFGYPNDEAYWGIPEAGYSFYEVRDTDWSDRLTEFNRLRFPDTKPATELRHFFMGCHDASGQFLVSIFHGPAVERRSGAVSGVCG